MLRSLAIKRNMYFRLCCLDFLLDFRLKVFKHLVDLWSNSIIVLGQSISSLHVSNFKYSLQSIKGRFPVLNIVYNYLFYKGINKLLLTKRDSTLIAFIYKL